LKKIQELETRKIYDYVPKRLLRNLSKNEQEILTANKKDLMRSIAGLQYDSDDTFTEHLKEL